MVSQAMIVTLGTKWEQCIFFTTELDSGFFTFFKSNKRLEGQNICHLHAVGYLYSVRRILSGIYYMTRS